MLYIPVQATLAIAWGPHYFGMGIALVFGVWAFIGLSRAGTSHCQFKVHCSVKVFWYVIFFSLMLLSGSFFTIYNITNWNVQIEAGFPNQCYRQYACVRVLVNSEENVNALNLTAPIFKNVTEQKLMKIVSNWFDIEIFETNRVIAMNSSYIHARFVTVFFGFIDDFYVMIVPYDKEKNEYAVVVQSESRLGTKDFGLNYERTVLFFNYLEQFSHSKKQKKHKLN